MCRNFLFALLLIAFSAKQLEAQCLGSCSCSTANTEVGGHKTLHTKGEWLITSGYSVVQYSPFSNDELMQWSTDSAMVYSLTSQQTARLGLQYNFTNRFRMSVLMPYNLSFDNREGMVHGSSHVMVNDYGNVNGFGDATLFAKYQWLSRDVWMLETGVGMKFPTGQTNTTSSNNQVAPPHLQPGTGSWDPVAALQVRRIWSKWFISEDIFGKVATKANDHNMGNYIGATTSANYQLIQNESSELALAIMGGILAEYNTKMKMPVSHNHGSEPAPDQSIVPFDNSGFMRLVANAGAVISAGNHMTVPLNFSIPIYENYNGHQVSMKWKANAGINFSF